MMVHEALSALPGGCRLSVERLFAQAIGDEVGI